MSVSIPTYSSAGKLKQLIWRTLPFLEQAHYSPQPPAGDLQESLSLEDLPYELIQLVASFLPTGSAASLALCNRSMTRILGTHYWEGLKCHSQGEQRKRFLFALERDLPNYFFCHYCSKLHHKDAPGFPNRSLLPQEQLPCYQAYGTICFQAYGYSLSFQHVQLALKRYRLGPEHGFDLDVLSHTQVYARCHHSLTRLKSIEPRFMYGQIFVRTQHWLLMRNGNDIDGVKFEFGPICPHLNGVRRLSRVSLLLDCKFSHLSDQKDCARCTGMTQCRYCPMEFQIDVAEIGDKGTAVILTQWLTLGGGLTPEDPSWWRHISGRLQVDSWPIKVLPGSIRAIFEEGNGLCFDGLNAKHAKMLHDSCLPKHPR